MTEITENKLISAKDAALKAVEYYRDITDYKGPLGIAEITRTEDGKIWHITLWHLEDRPRNPFMPIDMSDEKVYKSFDVNAETGVVVSMKIKQI